nr:glycosyltransferase [Providencia sp. PROV145]
MKNLADDMKWSRIHSKSKQMHDISGTSYKEKIFNYFKGTFLPPIEWFIPYHFLVNNNIKEDIIIEPGSRLISTKKKYICYCENGLGILSYNMKKNTYINKKIAIYMMKKKNFLGFVFYSQASRTSAYNLFGDIIKEKDLGVIYPYCKVPSLPNHTHTNIVTFGFCSSLFTLKGGRELVDAFIQLSATHKELRLDLLTRKSDIPSSYLSKISNHSFISITEFNLDNNSYFSHINDWSILIHPTYFDSIPLSIIEFINLNKPVIATDVYAIPECIKRENLLIDVKKIFNDSLLPKKGVFLDAEIIKLSKHSEPYSNQLKENLIKKIEITLKDKDKNLKLTDFNSDISPEEIKKKWNDLFEKINLSW